MLSPLPGLTGAESNGNEEALPSLKGPRLEPHPSDGLVSYADHVGGDGGAYLTPQQCILQPQLTRLREIQGMTRSAWNLYTNAHTLKIDKTKKNCV